MWIKINADSLLTMPDIGSGMESYRNFIGISKISAYGELCRYRHNLPTAAIDPESECNLLNNLKHELYGKTLIFTSHRLSAVHLADKIVLLENGQVKEEGSHKELLELNKEYARLYRLQMNTYNFS